MRGRCTIFIAVTLLATISLAHAQEDYRVLKVFKNAEEAHPYTGLQRATDGNFYGWSFDGLFRITPEGVYTMIAPSLSAWGFVAASDGYLYAGSLRDLIRISLDGETTVLHTLSDSLFSPYIVEGDDGNIYGFTRKDGSVNQDGTMFRMSPSGAFTTVRTVTAAEGLFDAQLIAGRDDGFYGSTTNEGLGYGTLFRLTLDGTATTLHVFTGGPSGLEGPGALLKASNGSLYGTTRLGGTYNTGTLFQLRPDGSFSVLYSFSGQIPGGDDITPWGRPLIEGKDGNLYGSGEEGIYRMTPDGEFRLLHSVANSYPGWAGSDRYGWLHLGRLAQGHDGNLYGAVYTGARGDGALFRLNLQRSRCANALDLVWQDYNGGTLYLLGALKSETPALLAAFLFSSQGTTPLWLAARPAVTPTFVFELALPLAAMGQIAVYSAVLTSDSHLCADLATVDTGGVGFSKEELNGMLRDSELLRNSRFLIPNP